MQHRTRAYSFRMLSTACARLAIFVWLTVLLLALAACGGDDSSTDPWDNGDADTPLDGDSDTDGDREMEASDGGQDYSPETLSGLWATKYASAYTVVLPVFNQKVQMILTAVTRNQAEVVDRDMSFTEEVCDFSISIVEDIDFHVTFPQDSVDAIPTEQRRGVFDELAAGSAFTVDQTLDIYGLAADSLDDPIHDPLPTEDDDPAVVDFESDGNPGVTARISGIVQGEVYVLFRLLRDTLGQVVSDRLIEGQVDGTVEMVTIGSNSPVLFLQLDLKPHPLPELNRFEFIRLNEDLDCPTLVERQRELFSYDPMDVAVPLEDD